MTKPKCKCPPGSPFHWHEDPRPSIFAKDPYFRGNSAMLSQNQTEVIERKHIAKLSTKTYTDNRISVRQFLIYSKAGEKL